MEPGHKGQVRQEKVSPILVHPEPVHLNGMLVGRRLAAEQKSVPEPERRTCHPHRPEPQVVARHPQAPEWPGSDWWLEPPVDETMNWRVFQNAPGAFALFADRAPSKPVDNWGI